MPITPESREDELASAIVARAREKLAETVVLTIDFTEEENRPLGQLQKIRLVEVALFEYEDLKEEVLHELRERREVDEAVASSTSFEEVAVKLNLGGASAEARARYRAKIALDHVEAALAELDREDASTELGAKIIDVTERLKEVARERERK
jgi:hypothetical protein